MPVALLVTEAKGPWMIEYEVEGKSDVTCTWGGLGSTYTSEFIHCFSVENMHNIHIAACNR